eukprot:767554-Pyramimonas_sp.AAC.1
MSQAAQLVANTSVQELRAACKADLPDGPSRFAFARPGGGPRSPCVARGATARLGQDGFVQTEAGAAWR